jgi:hypothetical protein
MKLNLLGEWNNKRILRRSKSNCLHRQCLRHLGVVSLLIICCCGRQCNWCCFDTRNQKEGACYDLCDVVIVNMPTRTLAVTSSVPKASTARASYTPNATRYSVTAQRRPYPKHLLHAYYHARALHRVGPLHDHRVLPFIHQNHYVARRRASLRH